MNTVQMHSILRRLFGYAKHKAMRADHAAAQDLAVAPASMAVS
ncbi:TPA: hypothetical protein ACNV5A_005237 [Aeromonas hydrophila]|nr:hypothetical protein [Klebsiella michiganensis]